MTCPLCGAAGKVVSVGAFGFRALCSECYEGDEEAPSWRLLDGMGDTAEQAKEAWLDAAREYAATEEIPRLPCQYRPRASVVSEVLEQARAEFERQRGWFLIDVEFEGENGERFDAQYLETEGV